MPTSTLRTWEQRYGVVLPQRSAGNYRLYDDEAVRRLAVMGSLVRAGWSAHEAAEQVVADAEAAAAQVPRPEVPSSDPGVGELVACAVDFDVARLERALSDAFSDRDVAEVVDEWLMPSMVRLGRAWQCGEVSIAGEHFVTAAVHRRLAHTFQTWPAPASRGVRVVVGLARGSRHELGILSFALVLRSRGVAVTYLGGDLPLEAWLGSVRAIGPAAVVLSAPTIEDLPAVREVVEALAPLTRVLLGGAYQHEVQGPHLLGQRAGAAAAGLAAELAAQPEPLRVPGVRER